MSVSGSSGVKCRTGWRGFDRGWDTRTCDAHCSYRYRGRLDAHRYYRDIPPLWCIRENDKRFEPMSERCARRSYSGQPMTEHVMYVWTFKCRRCRQHLENTDFYCRLTFSRLLQKLLLTRVLVIRWHSVAPSIGDREFLCSATRTCIVDVHSVANCVLR